MATSRRAREPTVRENESGGPVRGVIGEGLEAARVADGAAGERVARLSARCRAGGVDMDGEELDEVDGVAAAREREGVGARTAADIDDDCGRRRQVTLDDFLRACELEQADAGGEPALLEAALVVGQDGVGAGHGAHRSGSGGGSVAAGGRLYNARLSSRTRQEGALPWRIQGIMTFSSSAPGPVAMSGRFARDSSA
jgi:hypothetical protein